MATVGTSQRRPLNIAVICAASLLALGTARTRIDRLHGADESIARWVASVRLEWMARIVDVYESVLRPLYLDPIAAGIGLWLVLSDTRRRLGTALLIASIVTPASVEGAKQLFGAARPPLSLQYGHLTNFGYPSGHTATAVVYATLLLVFLCVGRRVLWIALLGAVAAAIGLGRIYTNAHYTTDVIGGVLLGGMVAATVVWATTRLVSDSGENPD